MDCLAPVTLYGSNAQVGRLGFRARILEPVVDDLPKILWTQPGLSVLAEVFPKRVLFRSEPV